MRKINYLLLFCLLSSMAYGQAVYSVLNVNKPLEGNQSLKAYKQINLQPGFSYTANSNSTLTAQIVPFELPRSIRIVGPDVICPYDLATYSIVRGDGTVIGGVPEDVRVTWWVPTYLTAELQGLNCYVSPMLGGTDLPIEGSITYNGETVTAQKNVRAVERFNSFFIDNDSYNEKLKADLNLFAETRYGISGYNWTLSGKWKTFTGTGSVYDYSHLPDDVYRVECAVSTICSRSDITNYYNLVINKCGDTQYCKLDFSVSLSDRSAILFAYSVFCDYTVESYKWYYKDADRSNWYSSEQYSRSFSIFGCGTWEVYCVITLKECPGKFIRSETKTIQFADCPEYKAYPNPAGDLLYVDLNRDGELTASGISQSTTYNVYLYNMSGNLLKSKVSMGGTLVEFNVSDLLPGVYYIHIHNGDTKEVKVEKITVER